jgi:chemotaxis protein CheD
VAVILYDPLARIGGIVHILLPKAPNHHDRDEKYADTGTKKLVEAVIREGATKARVYARLVGGAEMFSAINIAIANIGRDNIFEARRVLHNYGIRIVAEETAGKRGRSVYFDLDTGKVLVQTAFAGEKTI